MRVNPIPPVRVIPVPEQKSFDTGDNEFMVKGLEAARKKAFDEPDAHQVIAFSKGWAKIHL